VACLCFAGGDFTQLEPVRSKHRFLNMKFGMTSYVNAFIELKTNHRFNEDPAWGGLLQIIRTDGTSKKDLQRINTRVVCIENSIYERNIPDDAVHG